MIMSVAVTLADSKPPPPWASGFSWPAARRLAGVCEVLDRHSAGGMFGLDPQELADALGVGPTDVAGVVGWMSRVGYLRTVRRTAARAVYALGPRARQ